VALSSFSRNGNNSTLKQFQHFKRLVLFKDFRKLRNWKYKFTVCGQRRVELFSEKAGIHPGCGRRILSPLCPQEGLSVYQSSPGIVPSLQETGCAGINLYQLLSLFSAVQNMKETCIEVGRYTPAQWFRCSLKGETCVCSNYTPSEVEEHRS